MQYIRAEDGPAPIGPYSPAVRFGDEIFCSGMIAIGPDGSTLTGTTAAEQAEKALSNLAAVLRAAGASLSDVVKTTIYLIDMNDFGAVNEVYARHFGDAKPARSTVAVAALPRGALVEIDAIAKLS